MKRTHKKIVTEALRGKSSELLQLSGRDISELAAASNADGASFEGVDPRQKEMADAFEAVIGKVPPCFALMHVKPAWTNALVRLQKKTRACRLARMHSRTHI